RVLLDAGDAERRRRPAQRDHEPIVRNDALGEDHAMAHEVHVLHGVPPEPEAPSAAEVPDRLHDVARLDERRGDLRQQRREEQIVAIADEENLDVGATAKSSLEDANGLQAGEASAEDDDAHHSPSYGSKSRSWGVASGAMPTR